MQPAKLLRPLTVLFFISLRFSLEAGTWPAALRPVPVQEHVHAGQTLRSSSQLGVEWTAPANTEGVSGYRVRARDAVSTVEMVVTAEALSATLPDLKAATAYEITVEACLGEECAETLQSDEALTLTTEAEYWRIQGTGRSYATAAKVVPDGNVGSYAFRYGPWAGEDLDGRIQLYYSPLQREEKGAKIGELLVPRADSIAGASEFRGVSGFGLLRVCMPGPPGPPGSPPPAPDPQCAASRSLASQLALFQAIPLAAAEGEAGTVRLFFEAQGSNQRTRILYLDSQDGYTGRDFNRGSQTICATLEDYSPGGSCEPALAIGVDVDGPEHGNPNLQNARQFKIFYPTRDSTAWDQSPGTAMWFTTEWRDRQCSPFNFNQAYAVWDGERWVVQYQEDGCPKLLVGAQAAMPVHIGGSRYKVYFNRHAQPGGPSDPQIATKPMQVLYADPERTGDPHVVDFEDWEPIEQARDVHYLWPDGSALSEAEESKLDDYMILAPNPNDQRELILYGNMSVAGQIPFIGSAVLINP
jgi:hypothetical protein